MRNNIYIYSLLALALTISSCGQSPVSSAHNGSGSDVEACVIRSAVFDSLGNPITGAVVRLRRTDYLYQSIAPAAKRTVIHSDTHTNENGAFTFSDIDTGSYYIEITDKNSRATLYTCTVFIGDSLIELPADTLKAMARVNMSLSNGAVPVSVHIAGLDRYAYLTDSISFEVPEGRHRVVFTQEQAIKTQIKDLPLYTGSEVDLGPVNADSACLRYSCDSMVIAKILTLNGYDTRPEGVTIRTDTLTGRITELHIEGIPLDTIPPEIGHLSELNILHIRDTEINMLPPEIGQLKNCTELLLDSNRLVAIPEEIATLPKLETLDISNNQLGAFRDYWLPQWIGEIDGLIKLDVSYNLINKVYANVMTLPNLEKLDLSHNNLEFLPEASPMLPEVESLDISSNQLFILPTAIVHIPHIRRVDIDNNYFCSVSDTLKYWLDRYADEWDTRQNCVGNPYILLDD